MENKHKVNINLNYLSLRKYLGILGILMPLILILGNNFQVEESISHYYYTDMSVVFTGILVAFGLFLLSYRGVDKEKNEYLSDNLITNAAGVFAFIVAIIPTACEYCQTGVPNGHNDATRSAIHLVSAGLFIVIMGYMSFVQFSKSGIENQKKKRRRIVYKISGIVIWLAVLFLILKFSLDFEITKADTFWGESIALFFFGISWLVKGETLERMGL